MERLFVKIGIISDTHVSKEEPKLKYKSLIKQLEKIFKDVDEIIHAGDICEEWFIKELEKIAPIECIRGESDTLPHLKQLIKLKIGQYDIGVIHEPPEDMESFFMKNKINILIHGHTHYPIIQGTPYKTLILNPGSPTQPSIPPQKKGFMKPVARPTVITLNIDENSILSTYIITLKMDE